MVLDGFIDIHPINYAPPDAATYANIFIPDGVVGYVKKLTVQQGTGGTYERKILVDYDYSITPTDGNIPAFIGTGGEVEDSGVPVAPLAQFGGGIVGENLTADVNDFTVTGLASTVSLLVVPDVAGWKINGIQTGAIGRTLSIFNPTEYYFLLTHLSESCQAANRINSYTNANYVVLPGRSVTLRYDNDGGVWRIICETGDGIPQTGTVSPIGTVLPRWPGDRYIDTVMGASYEALTGSTVNDWKMMLQAPTEDI
jgi:hypothetical protein